MFSEAINGLLSVLRSEVVAAQFLHVRNQEFEVDSVVVYEKYTCWEVLLGFEFFLCGGLPGFCRAWDTNIPQRWFFRLA